MRKQLTWGDLKEEMDVCTDDVKIYVNVPCGDECKILPLTGVAVHHPNAPEDWSIDVAMLDGREIEEEK